MASVTVKPRGARAALVAAVFLFASDADAKKLRLISTTPDLADIVRRVAGDRADVESIARGPEDIHQVVLKPSHVSKLNRADAVIYYGLTLEHSFLPGLLDVAANPKIRPDWALTCVGTGCIDCSAGLDPLQKPVTLSRAEGEIHQMGNPHYNLSPENAVRVARNVADGLTRVDPPGAADYEKAFKAFKADWDPKTAEWKKLVAPLKGVKAVSYHSDIVYLAHFTGLELAGTIELKPGVAATPAHLERLVKLMKEQNVKLIVQEQQYERRTADWLAEKTGAKVAVIGTIGNWSKGTETLAGFQERNLKSLVEAVGGK